MAIARYFSDQLQTCVLDNHSSTIAFGALRPGSLHNVNFPRSITRAGTCDLGSRPREPESTSPQSASLFSPRTLDRTDVPPGLHASDPGKIELGDPDHAGQPVIEGRE